MILDRFYFFIAMSIIQWNYFAFWNCQKSKYYSQLHSRVFLFHMNEETFLWHDTISKSPIKDLTPWMIHFNGESLPQECNHYHDCQVTSLCGFVGFHPSRILANELGYHCSELESGGFFLSLVLLCFGRRFFCNSYLFLVVFAPLWVVVCQYNPFVLLFESINVTIQK